MKKLLSIITVCCLLAGISQAQDKLSLNKSFHGAVATANTYKAIYQLDTNAPERIEKAIRNINNLLDDPRLKGKIQVELIAFSKGADAYLKTSGFEEKLVALINRGVIVAECENTLRERKIPKEQLYDFIAYVPSANGELVIRAAEGWSIIKP
ncbi:MAG: DsrE family protein [Chitinophaga sp.]|uniref:DsrE family protein n=1 Tax=Chitinophaga sp. TaxID=1869181 RepID=UPI0025C09461|nr:DsrE family protein [Chitinophaga sp.]MBV8255092.1 DsrE family protein [Chitinophaga sp.]